MQQATTDDIAAVCSRIDAQTVIMITLAHEGDLKAIEYYKKAYGKLTAKYRNDILH
jgi:hypothetical protein